jgi:formate-dependent nitrite reductase membrane component NrfD
MKTRPDSDREKRLDEIRTTARERGVVADPGVHAEGGPMPRLAGYYNEPVVRPPVWTWEIPVYFFVGGLGGMAPTIGFAGLIAQQSGVARAAMLLAAVAAIASPILLILDLGRPHLFFNMLRVFKWRSAMSMGAWILAVFSPCAVGGLIAVQLDIAFLKPLLVSCAALAGLGLATYTGVLLGATAIPAWYLHHRVLPVHFGIAGLGSAAAIIELMGHRIRPLNALGFAVAILETAFWVWLELDRHGKADRAAHAGAAGWTIRAGQILTGPIALILRFVGGLPLAASSFLVGALVSRFGWLAAGRVSGRDPEAVFAAQSRGQS